MSPSFSLVRGGLLYRLAVSAKFASEIQPPSARVGVIFAAIAWLPLLGLALAQGVAFGDHVRVPLLADLGAYARYLIAIPLLFVADALVDRRLSLAVDELRSSGVVAETARPRLERAIQEVERTRDQWLPEALMFAAAVVYGWLGLGQQASESLSNWTAVGYPAHASWAGLWLAFVSLPIFSFLVLRWGWRVLMWARFLWRVSRLELELAPAHPDHAAGLGFLARAQAGFNMLASALAVVFAARSASMILYHGVSPDGLQGPVAAFVLLTLVLIQGPLLVFTPALARTKLQGLARYDKLARRYARSFDRKWVTPDAPAGELLGSPDIQSLADLEGSYQIVTTMRIVPMDWRQSLALVLSALVPMVPLLATAVPLQTILARLLQILGR